MAYCYALESRSGLPQVAYLDEIYDVMQHHSRSMLSGQSNKAGQDTWALEELKTESYHSWGLNMPHPFLLLVASNGLSCYFMHKIKGPDRVRETDKSLLLFHLILNFVSHKHMPYGPKFSRAKTLPSIEALLGDNLDPNTEIVHPRQQYQISVAIFSMDTIITVNFGAQDELTSWTYILKFLVEVHRHSYGLNVHFLDYCKLLELMIRAGGDLQLQVTNNKGKKGSASLIIRGFISLADAPDERAMAARILTLLDNYRVQGNIKYRLKASKNKLSKFFAKLNFDGGMTGAHIGRHFS